jgi:hypothetical protein
MNNALNITLAVARQQFEELMHLLPLEKLHSLNLGEGVKRQRIEALLEAITKSLVTIERELRVETDVPLIQIAASHIAFFREQLEPNIPAIRRAHWECIGIRDLFESLDEYEPEHPRHSAQDAIAWGLERWRDMLDDEELEDWRSRGFAIESAIKTVELPWFKPDSWLENMSLLRPVLMDKLPEHVPSHVRHRLTEIYRAFTFGLWMSSIALCRSLLEFSLKETAQRYGVEKTKIGHRGESEDKSMKALCDEFATRFPSLSEDFDRVRDTGNRIMHAKKNNVIAIQKVFRDETLDCIRSMRNSLETIYARTSG